MTDPVPVAKLAEKMIQVVATETRECAKHGAYQSEQVKMFGQICNWTRCEKCDDEETQKVEREEAERKRASRLRLAGIPPRFAEKGFKDYRDSSPGQQRVKLVCAKYAEEFAVHRAAGRCLVMVGVAGTGKTHLALAIAKAAMSQGFTAMYVTVYEVIEAIRATWRSDSPETESAVIRRLVAVDLLVLDEVGVQYGKESEQVEMFKVLNKRYNEIRPTIVISNCDVEGLKQYLGERSYDRLRENEGRMVTFEWESERGQK